MKRSILLPAIMCCFFGCSKDGGNTLVEIYTLKSFQPIVGRCQVNAATAVMEARPIVRNEDIAGYSPTEHEFTITPDAQQKIRDLRDGTGFALAVNGEVVYYGIYKPGYSSSICDNSITMSWPYGNKFKMEIGYPAPWGLATIADDRNAPGLLLVLRRQRKLY